MIWIFIVYVAGKILKLMFYGAIIATTLYILYHLYHFLKRKYVFSNLEKVKRLEISKPIQLYKVVNEMTGFSIGYHYTEHYKTRKVPDCKLYKIKVIFKNDNKMNIQFKDNSQFYTEMINISGRVEQ